MKIFVAIEEDNVLDEEDFFLSNQKVGAKPSLKVDGSSARVRMVNTPIIMDGPHEIRIN